MSMQEEGAQAPARARSAMRRALARAGGLRNAAGISLVAMLCAGALAPFATAVVALGPLALAGLGLAGNIGAEALADVLLKSIDTLRDGSAEDDPSEEALTGELASRLEEALSRADASGAALREATAQLLRESEAGRVVVEQIAAAEEGVRLTVAHGLTEVGRQFSEFAFLGSDIRDATLRIEASLREHRAEYRVESERMREQSLVLAQIREFLWQRDSASMPGTGASGPAWSGCPYLGLAAFTQHEAKIFYGRRTLTRQLCVALADRLSGGGVLIVTGASGSGKTSLLRAGLLPQLTRNALGPGSARWPCRVLTPTRQPLAELAAHLAEMSGQDARLVYNKLMLDPTTAAELAAVAAGAGRLLLIIDQFEELFTLVPPDPEGYAQRMRFIEAVNAISTVPVDSEEQAPGLVAIAVRGDFLDRALELPWQGPDPNVNLFTVRAMSSAELGEAINGPAAEAEVQVDPRLVEAVVHEAGDPRATTGLESGVLPLVSQAMASAWEYREGGVLTLAAYRRAGGLVDAVDRSAQSVYGSMNERRRAITQAVFYRLVLVVVDGEQRPVRRRCTRAELYQAAAGARGEVDAVIEAFARRRLLLLDREYVQIAHEVLLNAWNELRGWIESDLVDRVLYSQVVADAETWERERRDPAYLYRPGRIAEMDAVLARWAADPERAPFLPGTAEDFLDSGRTAARRAAHRRRLVIAVLSVLALLAGTSAIVAGVNASSARDSAAAAKAQHSVALSRQLAAEATGLDQTDPLLARQLAAASWAVSPTPQSTAAMASLLTEQEQDGMLIGHAGTIDTVAFNQTGSLLASGDNYGMLRLWDPSAGARHGSAIDTGSSGPGVLAIAFSPDGSLLATAEGNGAVRLWNAASGKPIATLGPADGAFAVEALAFNASGSILAVGGADGVRLWNPATRRQIGHTITMPVSNPEAHPVQSIALNPSGSLLATGSQDGAVRLWSTATQQEIGEAITPQTSTPGSVTLTVDVAFNPRGTVLATAVSGGVAQLWNPQNQRQIGPSISASADHAGMQLVAFDPAGGVLATADDAGVVRQWSTATGQELGTPMSVSPSAVHAIAYNPSGTEMAIAGGNGTLRLWNPITSRPVGASETADPFSTESDVTGDVLVSGGGGYAAHTWDPLTDLSYGPAISDTVDGGVWEDALDPSSRILATVDDRTTLHLWDIRTGHEIGSPLPLEGVGGTAAVTALVFSPDSQILAVFTSDGTMRLWNTSTRTAIGAPADAGDVTTDVAAAFNPSGTVLATIDDTGTVRLWDTLTQKEIGSPIDDSTRKTHGENSVAYSPDGSILAVGNGNGVVQLWDASADHEIAAPITVDHTGLFDLAFNPTGSLLATADYDGTVRLIDPKTGRQVGTPITADTDGDTVRVIFSYGGTRLLSLNQQGVLQSWDPNIWADPYNALCSEAGAVSASDWARYAPGEPEPAVCR
ncbi:WD40 repeat domain-containing protein [Actinospica sp. MGRD01-02]|uniref:WD40 repeat domain-containing protein n=1 Tax=Actinospica acidithermotolerans TaxID=2828514 RepID=A0A941E9M7_9ACTN|nr:WD40 repeat domain-containing protein [Actinospica acidithermotolerans]MBR7826387.1 WD40 repeat domain-containing protein [Actinospica acidithermotolerans]